MARLTIGSGINTYIHSLEQISQASNEMIGKAIFEGAAVVTDNIRSELEALPVDNRVLFKVNRSKGYVEYESTGMLNSISQYQKNGLLQSLGISALRIDNNSHNVKVGFDGYNGIQTLTWPKGQPNSMVALALESGTSFLKKNPVISRTTRASKAEAEKAMAEAFDKEIRANMNF